MSWQNVAGGRRKGAGVECLFALKSLSCPLSWKTDFRHIQWALDRAGYLQHEDPTAGMSGRQQHVMNLSTQLLKHCKQMRHRHCRAELSGRLYQAALAVRLAGSCSCSDPHSLASKPSSHPGTHPRQLIRVKHLQVNESQTGGFAFQALFTEGHTEG